MRTNRGKSVSEIQKLMNEAELHIMESNIEYTKVSFHELQEYFSEPAPSGDTTTLEDVLNNRWLLLHEMLELSELKRKGFNISARLLYTNPQEVEEAHYFATRWELCLARKAGDKEWIKRRLKHVTSWIEDPNALAPFIPLYRHILDEFSHSTP